MKLLLAYDGSECANAAVEDMSRAGLPAQGEAVVLSVGRIWPVWSEAVSPRDLEKITDEELKHAAGLAARGADRLKSCLAGWRVTADAVIDSPTAAIVKKADDWQADLVVVGSHGRSTVGRAILGSVSHSVLTHARCSVRIGRRRAHDGHGPPRLLIAIDGSAASATAVAAIARRKWPGQTEARVISVIESPDSIMAVPWPREPATFAPLRDWVMQLLERVARELRDGGINASARLCDGDPTRVILEEAEQFDADCIFVGAKGIGRVERFLIGSVSIAVASRARCSVEVIRQWL